MITAFRRFGLFASVFGLVASVVAAQSAVAAQPTATQTVQAKVHAQAAVKMSDPSSPDVIHHFPPTVIHHFP